MHITDYQEFLRVMRGKRIFIEIHIPDQPVVRVRTIKSGAITMFRAAEKAFLPFYADNEYVDNWGQLSVCVGIGVPGQPHPPGSPFALSMKEVGAKYPGLTLYLGPENPEIFFPEEELGTPTLCAKIVEIFHKNGYEDVEYDGLGVNFITDN